MKRNTGRRKFGIVFLIGMICAVSFFSVLAFTMDQPDGELQIDCNQFQVRSKVAFEGGKAFPSGGAEYNFAFKLSEGLDDPACPPVPLHTARVSARWDANAKRAYETIRHHPSARARLTQIVLRCPSNPWTAVDEPACTIIEINTDNEQMAEPPFIGALPLTAYHLGSAGRQRIASTIVWEGPADFITAPAMPPQIRAMDDGGDIDGRFFKRNADVSANIHRPADGSPEWYVKNPVSYDIEVQVKSVGGWAGKALVPRVAGDPAVLTLPYSRLFEDDESNWDIENFPERGKFRAVRIRARLHDGGTARPWSHWRAFLVQAPLRVIKTPSSIGFRLPSGTMTENCKAANYRPPESLERRAALPAVRS